MSNRSVAEAAYVPVAAYATTQGELILLATLVAFYGVMGPSAPTVANIAGPVWLIVALAYGMYRAAFLHPAGMWTALFWLRLATAVYFGFGAIVPFLVNDETRRTIDSFYAASPLEMLKVNLVTAVGVFSIMVGSAACARVVKRIPWRAPSSAGKRDLLVWGGAFLAIGLAVKYGLVLPYVFGVSKWVPPGFVLNLPMLVSVGLYLIFSWAFTSNRAAVPFIVILWLWEMLVGLASFAKIEVIFTLMMLALATMHAGVTKARLAVAVGVAVFVFTTIVPIVGYGRTVLLYRYESLAGAPLNERIAILEDYVNGGAEDLRADPFRENYQGHLSRLSYMNQASFAVAEYDAGRPGDSLSAIPIVVIPRILWPDKPNMNYLTQGFTRAAMGGETSLTWPGRYAEFYWDMGWFGAIVGMFLLAPVHVWLSWLAISVFGEQRWVYFPIILFGMRYGMDITSTFATAGVGALLILLAGYFVCWVADGVVSRRRGRPGVGGWFQHRT